MGRDAEVYATTGRQRREPFFERLQAGQFSGKDNVFMLTGLGRKHAQAEGNPGHHVDQTQSFVGLRRVGLEFAEMAGHRFGRDNADRSARNIADGQVNLA